MKNLQPTLTASLPTVSFAGVLQLLEQERASGTVRLDQTWIRLRAGVVVKTSAPAPADAVRELLQAEGQLEFRAVRGDPTGPDHVSPTALLLDAARELDEAVRS